MILKNGNCPSGILIVEKGYSGYFYFRDILHIFTFGIRARSKEHRVNMESEDPKRGAAVTGILGKERDSTCLIPSIINIGRSDLAEERT